MRPALFLRTLLAAAALGAVLRLARGDGAAPAVSPPPAPQNPQQQASFDTLDRALARFDALIARDDDAHHQAATRAVLDALKKRRDALRAAFDGAKVDDLRTELSLEYHREAAWVGPAAATH